MKLEGWGGEGGGEVVSMLWESVMSECTNGVVVTVWRTRGMPWPGWPSVSTAQRPVSSAKRPAPAAVSRMTHDAWRLSSLQSLSHLIYALTLQSVIWSPIGQNMAAFYLRNPLGRIRIEQSGHGGYWTRIFLRSRKCEQHYAIACQSIIGRRDPVAQCGTPLDSRIYFYLKSYRLEYPSMKD